MMKHKFGDIREDGYIFVSYHQRKDRGPVHTQEIWRSPVSFHRSRISKTISASRKTAATKGLPFDIDAAYLLSIWPQDGICPVLGIKLEWGSASGYDCSPSLDKMIPELGYVRGNVAWISHRANRLKSDMSLTELERILAYMTPKRA